MRQTCLPISNPANLVVFGSHIPPLLDWLWRFSPIGGRLFLSWSKAWHTLA